MEASRAVCTYENSKPKEYHISGGILEINFTVKDLKGTGVLIPTTSPIQPIHLACIENTWILRITGIL